MQERLIARRNLYPMVAVCLLLIGCGHSGELHLLQPPPLTQQGWHYRDAVMLKMPDSLAADYYDVAVAVRYRKRYAYLNLSLIVADSLRSDTLHIRLFDAAMNPVGESSLSLVYTKIPYLHRFPKHCLMGQQWYLRHFMRDDYLQNIEEVGFILTPTP